MQVCVCGNICNSFVSQTLNIILRTQTQYFMYCSFYNTYYQENLITYYQENLITHFHHNILFTIKPEGSSREIVKQEQKEKLQPALRSSVSKQLQYIDIRGVSL
jgi:hypothetical protein